MIRTMLHKSEHIRQRLDQTRCVSMDNCSIRLPTPIARFSSSQSNLLQGFSDALKGRDEFTAVGCLVEMARIGGAVGEHLPGSIIVDHECDREHLDLMGLD